MKKKPVKWKSEQAKHVKCSQITLQEDESPHDLSHAAGPRVGINQNRDGKKVAKSLLWNSAVHRVARTRKQPPVTKCSSSRSSQPLTSDVARAEAKGLSLASCPLAPHFLMKTGFSVFPEGLCWKDCTLCAFCFLLPKRRLQRDRSESPGDVCSVVSWGRFSKKAWMRMVESSVFCSTGCPRLGNTLFPDAQVVLYSTFLMKLKKLKVLINYLFSRNR